MEAFTHALHVVVIQRVWHTAYAMQVPLAAAAFMACEAWRGWRVMLELAVHSRCARHGCSRRGSSKMQQQGRALARSWAALSCRVWGLVCIVLAFYFPGLGPGWGDRRQSGLVQFFSVTSRITWSYLPRSILNGSS